MTTLHLTIAFSSVAAAFGLWNIFVAYQDYRAAVDVNAPVPYMPTAGFNENLHSVFAAQVDEGVDDVDTPESQPSYTVAHRRNHSVEFDTSVGYIRAASETRVWPDGHREHVFLIGDVDFALTDAPQLAAALLGVYFAQLDAEGLIVKASHDD